MSFLKDHKYLVLLLVIFFTGFFLRFKLSQDPYLHNWDEKFHALVSKNMMDQSLKPVLYKETPLPYDFKRWYGNHIWLHKQPLPLWLISYSYTCFGISEFVTRLPSLIFSCLAILITYSLGCMFYDKRVGILSAFFMSVNGLVVELTSGRITTDHYDILFMAFIEISILFAFINSKSGKIGYCILSGAFMGFAMLTKWLPCLIVLPVHFFLMLHHKENYKRIILQLGASLFVCLAIGLPWQFFISKHYPAEAKWEYHYNWLHFTTPLEGQGDSLFYYFEQIRINYSEIIYLPLLFFLYKLIKNRAKDHRHNALFIWIFVPLIFFTIAQTKMQGYILFICPALFMITAYFFFEITDRFRSSQNTAWKIALCLVLISMIVMPLRYCFERTQFGLCEPKYESYHVNYKTIKTIIPQKAVVFNVAHPIEFMFYNSCIAYAKSDITQEELSILSQQGYTPLIYLPEENSLKTAN